MTEIEQESRLWFLGTKINYSKFLSLFEMHL